MERGGKGKSTQIRGNMVHDTSIRIPRLRLGGMLRGNRNCKALWGWRPWYTKSMQWKQSIARWPTFPHIWQVGGGCETSELIPWDVSLVLWLGAVEVDTWWFPRLRNERVDELEAPQCCWFWDVSYESDLLAVKVVDDSEAIFSARLSFAQMRRIWSSSKETRLCWDRVRIVG